MTDLVVVSDDGPVRTVRMNRPEKKNALTFAMYDTMADAIEGAGRPRRALPPHRRPAHGAFAPATTSGFPRTAIGSGGLARPSCGFCRRWCNARYHWSRRCRACGRRRHHDADALRSRGRRRRGAVFHALRRSRPGAGSRFEPDRTAIHGLCARVFVAGDGARARRRGRRKPSVSSILWSQPTRSKPKLLRPRAKSPRCRRRASLASRRLMRGSPDEIVQRIDEEAELFKTRLQSAEARAAFEAFMMRKR